MIWKEFARGHSNTHTHTPNERSTSPMNVIPFCCRSNQFFNSKFLIALFWRCRCRNCCRLKAHAISLSLIVCTPIAWIIERNTTTIGESVNQPANRIAYSMLICSKCDYPVGLVYICKLSLLSVRSVRTAITDIYTSTKQPIISFRFIRIWPDRGSEKREIHFELNLNLRWLSRWLPVKMSLLAMEYCKIHIWNHQSSSANKSCRPSKIDCCIWFLESLMHIYDSIKATSDSEWGAAIAASVEAAAAAVGFVSFLSFILR